MPQTVAHFLFAALLVALFRDYYLKRKDRKTFPLHYVLLAGIGGVLPDIDLAFYFLLKPLGFAIGEVHRTITHSLTFALFFLIIGFVFHHTNVRALTRHKLKLSIICFVLAFGICSHLFLDAAVSGENIKIFYPFSDWTVWNGFLQYFSVEARSLFAPVLDGVLLLIWVIYLEVKHKISDFV